MLKKREFRFLFVLAVISVFAFAFTACGDGGLCGDGDLDLDLDIFQGPGPEVDGIEYSLGEEGPGGGIIFFIDPEGFTVEGYGEPDDEGYFEEYIAYYLEVTPVRLGVMRWAIESSPASNNLVTGLSITPSDQTDWDIGRGRKNTALILAYVSNPETETPAAYACKTYGTSNDWFLPSRNELNLLFLQKGRISGIEFTDSIYLSSSQGYPIAPWSHVFLNRGQQTNNYLKTSTLIVHPVRAF